MYYLFLHVLHDAVRYLLTNRRESALVLSLLVVLSPKFRRNFWKPRLRYVIRERELKYGGLLVGKALAELKCKQVFTVGGGHVAPVLVGCKTVGVQVIQCRNEGAATHAAAALARVSSQPGVVVVTSGPGLTNALTAIQTANTTCAPLVVLLGAPPSLMRERGCLQELDHRAAVRPFSKWFTRVPAVRDIVSSIETAFEVALSGCPGPAVVELPLDLLFREETVRQEFGPSLPLVGGGVRRTISNLWREFSIRRIFRDAWNVRDLAPFRIETPVPSMIHVHRTAERVIRSRKPVLVLGGQVVTTVSAVPELRASLEQIGAPVFMSGAARGVLPFDHALSFRHHRADALANADTIVLCGVPLDFRMHYGTGIPADACVIAINRDGQQLSLNRDPDIAVRADPCVFLTSLCRVLSNKSHSIDGWQPWVDQLRQLEAAREEEIRTEMDAAVALAGTQVHPMQLCAELDKVLDAKSVLVFDGGDIVATAAYIVRPRRVGGWIDAGPFGAYGAGLGYALGAKVGAPDADVWLLCGDGTAGTMIQEIESLVRNNVPAVVVVGNDCGASAIRREQVSTLGDAIGCELPAENFDELAVLWGAHGMRVSKASELPAALLRARTLARETHKPVCVNVLMTRSEFRAGHTHC